MSTVVPVGAYAVPDPDDPEILTSWTLDADGRLRPYPPGVRWAPLPPPQRNLTRAERRRRRLQWYADVYHPWKADVLRAIAINPGRAAQAFTDEHGDVDPALGRQPAGLRPQRRAQDMRRAARLEVLAAGLRALTGQPAARVARDMGLARSTGYRRVTAGLALWRADPAGCRDELLAAVGHLDAPALAAAIDRLFTSEAFRRTGGET